jgi:hypothetical protein
MKYPTIQWLSRQVRRLLLLENEDRFLRKTGGTMTGSLVLAEDPVLPLEAATKQYVDEQRVEQEDAEETYRLVVSSPTNIWILNHNKGRRPSSVRILINFAGYSGLYEAFPLITDTDVNTSIAEFDANYTGEAIAEF